MSSGIESLFTRWLRCYQPRPSARLRLVCFPHAGGSASFYSAWMQRMPAHMELLSVQYPGRGSRVDEPLLDDMHRLADAIAVALTPIVDRPLALFGHSMGALVAYEVALRISPPALLFVSARQAPLHARPGRKHLADDDTLWAEALRLGGVDELLVAQRELRALVLPVLRNDFRMLETYRPLARARLRCPIVGLAADADPVVAVDEVPRWADLTRSWFRLRVFPGDHFYLLRQREQVVADVVRDLDEALP
jgi:pyochelin biosynthesis protein PchC